MQSVSGLIVRLERSASADRRLDAEIMGTVLGPPGWVINPFESPDGWDIEVRAGEDGETLYWMEAADVPHLTRSLEDAISFAEQVRPADAAHLVAHAMRQMPLPERDDTGERYAQRVARALVAAVLRAQAVDVTHGQHGRSGVLAQAPAA